MNIEHEIGERSFHAGERPLQDHETRARQFRRRLEIHEAEPLTDIEMLLRLEGKYRDVADRPNFEIVVLVRAIGNVVVQYVRDSGKQRVEFVGCRLFLGFGSVHRALDLGDLGLELFRLVGPAILHGGTDLLRGCVASLLHLLQPRLRSAPARVDLQNLGG